MLHYLVTYVRDTLDKESLDAIPSAESIERTAPNVAGISRLALLSRPELRPDMVGSGEPTCDTAGTRRVDPSLQSSKTNGGELNPVESSNLGAATLNPQDISAEELARRETFSPRSGTALLLMLTVYSVTGIVGCACFRREKVDANVVSSRQLSLQGIDALQRGQWEDAENRFASALQKNPADERAHRHYAEVMWHRGEHKTAIRHMEKSVRLSGGDSNLLVQLGEMYLKQGNVDAASECADEAIDANNQLSGAWALRGDIHRQRGEPSEAMECYHRAVSHQPHYPHVQMALADLYRQADKPRRALATLSSLAGQYPPDKVPQEVEFQRGLALKALGRYRDAVETFAAATQRGEPNADLLYHLSEAQFLAGNAASARLALQAALTKAPSHSAGLKLHDKLERHSQAMTAAVDRK